MPAGLLQQPPLVAMAPWSWLLKLLQHLLQLQHLRLLQHLLQLQKHLLQHLHLPPQPKSLTLLMRSLTLTSRC